MIGSPGILGASQKTAKSWQRTPQISAWATAVDQAKRYNVLELATKRSELRRASAHELQGPCPKCGGTDRLHVRKDGWFCRNCKPFDAGHGWNDAIDWMQHMDNKTFDDAVTTLTGIARDGSRKANHQAFAAPSKAQPVAVAPAPQTEEWRAKALPIVEDAQKALSDGDNVGLSYLTDRGLTLTTCEAFGFGFGSFRNQPAIVIPWTRGGQLQAIRYRYIMPMADSPKVMSEPGSRFAGILYGGQTICGCMEHKRTLVICEGEINAASIWQATAASYLDVLSMGSESAILPQLALDYAAKFRTCIVWMDKADIARKWAGMIPGAVAVASPNGMDANDLLKLGRLTYFLAHVRAKAATTPEKREALKWDLLDQQDLGGKIDNDVARLIGELS